MMGSKYLQAGWKQGLQMLNVFLKQGASCFVFGNSLPDSRTS